MGYENNIVVFKFLKNKKIKKDNNYIIIIFNINIT